MDALFAKADAIRPYKKRKFNDEASRSKKYMGNKEVELDSTAKSVLLHTSLPKSLRPGSPPPKETNKYSQISDKKLRAALSRQSAHSARSKALLEDAAFLLEHEESGTMEVEGDLEKTWRVGQNEIIESAGQEASMGRREWKLDGGPYRSRYTRNGRYMHPIQFNIQLSQLSLPLRHLAIVGLKGHVATFDWKSGIMHSELQLRETCRDITFVCQALTPKLS